MLQTMPREEHECRYPVLRVRYSSLTISAHLSQRDFQEIWSHLRRNHLHDLTDTHPSPPARAIRWLGPIEFLCERCDGRSVGTYCAYRIGETYGIVEDTPTSYLPGNPEGFHPPRASQRAYPGRRIPRSKPRFRIVGNAEDARAYFTCGRCNTQFERVVPRLARKLFEKPQGHVKLQP